MSVKIEVCQIRGIATLTITGCLTLDPTSGSGPVRNFDPKSGALQLKATLKELRETGVTKFQIDLANTTSIDSDGAGILLSNFVDLSIRGGELKLLNPSPKVMRYLRITNLDTAFCIQRDKTATPAT